MDISFRWIESSCIAGIVETAVPCCIRHAKGQETPALELPYKTPYEHALEQLRKLQQRQHHSEKQQEQLGYLDTKKCKDIASKLLDTSYTIPDKVEGEESIRELVRLHSVSERPYIDYFQLAILNVLTRFSIITEDEIDVGTPDQWPLLTAEFRGLMAFTKSAAKLRNSVCFQVSVHWLPSIQEAHDDSLPVSGLPRMLLSSLMKPGINGRLGLQRRR